MKTFSIIGMGNISKKHIEAINKNNGKLIASCDIDPKKYPDYLSYQSLALEIKSDYYVIATPHGTHFEIAKYLLMNTKSKIIIEKPIVTTTYEYFQLVDYKDRIIPVLQNRYYEDYNILKDKLNDTGEIISEIIINLYWNRPEEYFRNSLWRGSKRHSDNVVMNQMIHYIDLAQSLTTEYNKFNILYNHKVRNIESVETFDSINAGILLNNGTSIKLNGSLSYPGKNFRNEIIIKAEKNTYLLDFNNVTKNEYGTYQGSLSLHNEFYRDLITTGKTKASFDDSYKSLYICESLSNKELIYEFLG